MSEDDKEPQKSEIKDEVIDRFDFVVYGDSRTNHQIHEKIIKMFYCIVLILSFTQGI